MCLALSRRSSSRVTRMRCQSAGWACAGGTCAAQARTVEGFFAIPKTFSIHNMPQAGPAGLAECRGRREVAGQFQGDGALPEVAEARGGARQGGVQDFANLTTQDAGFVHEVAAMTAEQLQRDIQSGPVRFAQTEAVGGSAEDGRQVRVIGLVPRVGGLAVLLGGEGVHEAGVETGLAEGTLRRSVVVAGAFQ